MYYKCNKKSEKIKNSKTIPDDDEIKIFQNSLSNIINDKMKILSILKNVKKEGNGESKENLQANYIEKLSQNIQSLEKLNKMCNNDILKLDQYLTYLDPNLRDNKFIEESRIINERSFIIPEKYLRHFDPTLVSEDEETNKLIPEIKNKLEDINKKIIRLLNLYKEEKKLASLKKELEELEMKYNALNKKWNNLNKK